MNSYPCISSSAYDAAVIAFLLGVAGFCALVYAMHVFREAMRRRKTSKLGLDLLEACAGDWPSAEKAIANVAAENELLDLTVRNLMQADRDYYRSRLARFNEDCW